MTRRTVVAVAGLVLGHLVLHVTFGLGRVAPDLFVVAVLLAARVTSIGASAGIGLALGLVEDAFSTLSFGASGFALTVVGALGSRSRDVFVGDSVSFLFTYFTVGKWLRDLLAWTASDSMTRPDFVGHVLMESPVVALYAGVVGLAVAWLLRWERAE